MPPCLSFPWTRMVITYISLRGDFWGGWKEYIWFQVIVEPSQRKKGETLKSQRSVRRGLICSWGMSWVWTKCGSVKQPQMRLKVCKWCFIGMGCRSTLNVNQRKIWTPRLFRNNGCIMNKHMEGQEMKANQLALLCAVKDFLLSLI